MPTARKSIRFGTDQVKLVEALRGEDLWSTQQSCNARRSEDEYSLVHNCLVVDYITSLTTAYTQFATQFTASCKTNDIEPPVANDIQERVQLGAKLGYRGMEYLDDGSASDERQDREQQHVQSILSAYHIQGKRDEDLQLHCQPASSVAQHWANFIGSVDAVAAVDLAMNLQDSKVEQEQVRGCRVPCPVTKRTVRKLLQKYRSPKSVAKGSRQG